MHDRVEVFLRCLSHQRRSSKNTIAAYGSDLRGFVRFIEAQEVYGSDAREAMSRRAVIAYIAELNCRQYAKSTVARKVAAVRSFYAFLLERGDLTTNPAAEIDSPRASKSMPKSMTPDEIDALLREPKKHHSAEAARDAAMLELMYATGMRVTELISLNVDSLHLDPPPASVRCRGRGGRERTIPISNQAIKAMADYLDQARPVLLKTRSQSALFVNRRGERLTRQGFWLIFKKYVRGAGINGRVTPHTLRHSFAAHLLCGGASVRDVQELLGHANASTTQVYTQLVDARPSEVSEGVVPRLKSESGPPQRPVQTHIR